MARTPITWKNVDAPDLTRAAYIQQLASQQFDKAFESAGTAVDTYDQHQKDVLERNSTDFRNRLLQQYQSPEALREAQGAGEIDALRSRYANNGGLDLATTGAERINTMVGDAQQRVEADQQYSDNRALVNDRATNAAARNLVYDNKHEEAAAKLRSQYEAGELSEASLVNGLDLIEQDKAGDATAAAEQRRLALEGQRVGLERDRVGIAQDANARAQTDHAAKLEKAAEEKAEAEEAEWLSVAKSQGNMAEIQKRLDSGELLRPDLAQAEIRTGQVGAIKGASQLNVAMGELDAAEAAANQLPVEERFAELANIEKEREALQKKDYTEKLTLAEQAGTSAALDELRDHPQFVESDISDKYKKLVVQEEDTAIVRNIFDTDKEQRARATTAYAAQQQLESELGVKLAVLNSDPTKQLGLLKPEQLVMVAKALGEGRVDMGEQVSYTTLTKQLQNKFMAEDDTLLPKDAMARAEGIMEQVQEGVKISKIERQERQDLIERRKDVYKGNDFIENTMLDRTDVQIKDFMGDDNYAAYNAMTGTAKKAADEVVRWVQLGYIPADGNKRMANLPLTPQLLDFAFNTTTGGTSAFADVLLPGTVNAVERVNQLLERGIFDPEKLAEYEAFMQQVNEQERRENVNDDAASYVNEPAFTGTQIGEALVTSYDRQNTEAALEAARKKASTTREGINETTSRVAGLQYQYNALKQQLSDRDYSGTTGREDLKEQVSAIEAQLRTSRDLLSTQKSLQTLLKQRRSRGPNENRSIRIQTLQQELEELRKLSETQGQ